MTRGSELDRATRIALLQTRLHRRTLMGTAAGVAGLAAFGGRAATGTLAQDAPALPADAAPPERQTMVFVGDATVAKVLDFYEQVYQRPGAADLFSEALVRLDKNFQISPAAALEWSSSEDGKTWTFQLAQNLVWSDGNKVTAADWVKTFQYGAEAGRWDFSWFWDSQGKIKNWSQAIAGEMPVEEIGVRQGDDEFTLIFETEDVAPFMPAKLLYSLPLSKAALESTGPLYNTDPATAVSSGPFILSEWIPEQEITLVRNESYAGSLQVPIQKVICKLTAVTNYFTLYENDEIDYMANPSPDELTLVQEDEEMSKQIYTGVGDFRTFYLFFDVTKAPFDDIKVRQAISHAIDRDAIQTQILGPLGTQAYSWLAPGFPASDREGLAGIQNFDPAAAKALLAEAGFPDGEGFPKQELWLRNENALNQTVAQAAAQMITENLGIEIEVSNKDYDLYMSSLNAKPTELLFGYVSYGMDFLDPSNMLGVWKSGGRHSWVNEAFDAKLAEASSFLGDPNERLALFKEAERILVEDVPGVFVYHATEVQLIKPWVKGEALEPDENGIASLHWPGYAANTFNPPQLYITNDGPDRG
jgi:peptide/nickel transport system substrate-binding protein/oligopeptide transport system substrate-binding protein